MQPPKEMNFSSAGFDSTLLHTRSVESSSGGGGGGKNRNLGKPSIKKKTEFCE